MKNVLFISYYFPPMGGAGVQRSAKFVKYLPEFGWRPIVIAAAPETYHVHREFQFDRTVGDGLEKVDHEVHHVRDPEPRKLRRFLERIHVFPFLWFFLYPLFWEPELLWALAAARKGLQLVRKKRIGMIYTSSGPFCTVLTGLLLRSLTRKPWVADLEDPWTECFRGAWPSRAHRWLERKFASWALRHADIVIANTPVAKGLLLELVGKDTTSHFRVVPNGYDEADFSAVESSEVNQCFTLTHVGTFDSGDAAAPRKGWRRLTDIIKKHPTGYDTKSYSARYLFDALHLLLARGQLQIGSVCVKLVGDVPTNCRAQAEAMGLRDMVEFHGYVEHKKAIHCMNSADALWLPLPVPDDGKQLQQVSGKLYEYIRSGKPVLGLLPPGDAHDVLRESGLGFFADPRNPEDIACVLLDLYTRHRNGGIAVQPNWAFIHRFERKELTRQLASILDSTAKPAVPRKTRVNAGVLWCP